MIVRADRPGTRLVAYVVRGAGRPDDVVGDADLRRGALPDYMVPAAFVVARRAAADRQRQARPRGAARRRTPRPRCRPRARARRDRGDRCAGCSPRCSACRRVGVDDDFFALGGHSLLATRLVSRVRAALGVELADPRPVRGADRRRAGRPGRRAGPAPAPARAGRRAERPDAAAAVVRAAAAVVPRPARRAPAPPTTSRWSFRLRGALDVAALRGRARRRGRPGTRRCARCSPSATACRTSGSSPADAEPAARTVDGCAEDELAGAVAEAARAGRSTWPPSCRCGPTLLARSAPDEHVLVAGAAPHRHRRLVRRGRSCATWPPPTRPALPGAAPEWAPLPVQYADYTLWQRELLGDPADPDSLAAPQLGYWRAGAGRAARGARAARPTGRARPAPTSAAATVRVRAAAPTCTPRLRELARASDRRSMFMVLHAGARGAAAPARRRHRHPARHADRRPRPTTALDDLVGFFVNTLVLRTDLSRRPDVRASCWRRVRDADLAAFAHQDVPFERLVEALNPARSPARNPLFQVMVGYQQRGRRRRSTLPGLTVRGRCRSATGTAKFDLSFSFADADAGTPGGSAAGSSTPPTCSTRDDRRALADRLRAAARPRSWPTRPRRSADVDLLDRRRAHQVARRAGTTPTATVPAERPCRRCSPRRWPRTPDAVAVVDGADDGSPTRELDARAEPARATCWPRAASGPRTVVGARAAALARTWSSRCCAVAQAGRGVPAARPGLPGRRGSRSCSPTPGPAACSTTGRRPVEVPDAAPVAGARRRPDVAAGDRRRRRRRGPIQPGLDARVRDLHVRLDRPAQGRGGHARRRSANLVGDRRSTGCGCAADSRVLQYAVVRLRRGRCSELSMALCVGGDAWSLAPDEARTAGAGADRVPRPRSAVTHRDPAAVAGVARCPTTASCRPGSRSLVGTRGRAAGAGRAGGRAGRRLLEPRTARPRRRSTATLWQAGPGADAARCRSARRTRTPGCTCWTTGCGRCRPGCRASCTSAGARPGPRLPRPRRADRGAVRRRPVRRARRADVPHRRPGALARRRRAGVPRPGRRPGEDPRLPDRARRDRGGARPRTRPCAQAAVVVREDRPGDRASSPTWSPAAAAVDPAELRAFAGASALPELHGAGRGRAAGRRCR